MRRLFLVVCAVATTAVFADAGNFDSLYLVPKNGTGPRVVDAMTGIVQPVHVTPDGKKPVDCPPEGFWSAAGALFRCKDDFKFLLVSPRDPAAYPAGALILKSSNPGTDDPGPSAPKVK
ncbi:hypothetical protein [Mesorhizobium sp. BR1-1-4]|uniref:hypothetical protein n=1 Tax=Mesorhizobium sp. BR1-1-4 TaxID=2876650 RepID=UPI001CCC374B|nr:hypothetical protein [Mesorhizobium sp. BR1-1-4]MBZ9926775.1 hypothetical protein [Mesorhizobium sp. BR1-1-4]